MGKWEGKKGLSDTRDGFINDMEVENGVVDNYLHWIITYELRNAGARDTARSQPLVP